MLGIDPSLLTMSQLNYKNKGISYILMIVQVISNKSLKLNSFESESKMLACEVLEVANAYVTNFYAIFSFRV